MSPVITLTCVLLAAHGCSNNNSPARMDVTTEEERQLRRVLEANNLTITPEQEVVLWEMCQAHRTLQPSAGDRQAKEPLTPNTSALRAAKHWSARLREVADERMSPRDLYDVYFQLIPLCFPILESD